MHLPHKVSRGGSLAQDGMTHTIAHMHTCTLIHIHTHVHTHKHTRINTHIHTHIHTHTHSHTRTRTHTHKHTHAHIHTHTHTSTHAHTHDKHLHTHAHTGITTGRLGAPDGMPNAGCSNSGAGSRDGTGVVQLQQALSKRQRVEGDGTTPRVVLKGSVQEYVLSQEGA